MTRRLTLLLAAALAALLGGAGAAPAETARTAAVALDRTGYGALQLGRPYGELRSAGVVGTLRRGCELASPRPWSARLRRPLRGDAEFAPGRVKRLERIVVTGNGEIGGVRIGARRSAVRAAFPHAHFDASTEDTFGITLVHVPRRDGGPFQLALDAGLVTIIGLPSIPFCE